VLAKVEHAAVEADNEDSEFLGHCIVGRLGSVKNRRSSTIVPEVPEEWLTARVQEPDDTPPPSYRLMDVEMDRGRRRSRLCWGIPIFSQGVVEAFPGFYILLHEQRDRSKLVFAICGAAKLDDKPCLELFEEGATEESIQVV
jgi:hypothetical protein